MTKNEVKEKLQGYRAALRRQERAERELEVFTARMLPSVDYTIPKVEGGKSQDVSDYIDELTRIHKLIAEEYEQATKELIEVKKLLLKVEDARKYEILSRRYISCQHWDVISYEMRLDRRWMFRLHDRALSELAEEGGDENEKTE